MIGTSPPQPSAAEIARLPVPYRDRVAAAAAPVRVAAALRRIETAAGGLPDRELPAAALVAVADASRFLVEHVVRHPADIALLDDAMVMAHPLCLDVPPVAPGELAPWKRRGLLHIAARDLLRIADVSSVGAEMAALADACVGAALQVAMDGASRTRGDDLGSKTEVAVIGMGKLGAQELNYGSDIDVLFVHRGDGDAARRITQRVMRMVGEPTSTGAVFRIDADLRPEGKSGPLSRSLDAYTTYWDRWAETWEFQALLKARPIAGSTAIGAEFMDRSRQFVFPARRHADEIRTLRRMKTRAEEQVRETGLAGREVKLGPGGIRDIEFAVQILQLVHGRSDPVLRVPATLPALGELARGGYIAADDGAALEESYRFLRIVEHRLQLEDDQQTHLLPEGAALVHLARVLGYRDRVESDALDQFRSVLRRHATTVRTVHERLFYRPLLDALSASSPLPSTMSRESALERLGAFGFRRGREIVSALLALTSGLSRTSGLMRTLIPLMLEWLTDTPDPDLGLVQLQRIVEAMRDTSTLVVTFRDNPVAAERLCKVVGTSRLAGDLLRRQPQAVGLLALDDIGGTRSAVDLRSGAHRQLELRERTDAALRAFKNRELARIAARDILDVSHDGSERQRPPWPGDELAALADACLDAALTSALGEITGSDRPAMAVMAFGRYGGAELSYASDLDVMIVHEGGAPGAAEKVATRLLALVGDITPEGQTFRVDPDLRPEGKAGLLTRSLAGYQRYWSGWAETWEIQALLRARPAAGDLTLASDFLRAAAAFSPPRGGLTDEQVRQIRHQKARIERERIPAGEDKDFHLKLGRGGLADIEFTVQLAQLRFVQPGASVPAALSRLVACGAISERDAAALLDCYRFCGRVRDRVFLIKGRLADSLPTDPDEARRIAESLGYESVDALRAMYRRMTRRVRPIVDRLFWGRS